VKALRKCLAGTLALLALAPAAGANTLDSSGTGPEAWPGYFCRSPFDFVGMSWNKQYALFTIDVKGQCGVIQDPSKYMPGWGGGGADFKNVDVAGVYHYADGTAKETVRHEGKIILETSLKCDKNPWVHPIDSTCTVAPLPAAVNNSGVAVNGPYPVSAKYVETSAVIALGTWEQNKDKPDPLADWDPTGTPPGYSALTIAGPTPYQSIPDTAPGFSLALGGIPPGSSARVLMNWQNMVQGPEWAGDIHLSEEARWDWWAFPGPPPFAMAGAFPLTVAVNPGFFVGKPGLYRLQVKLESETWWSRWQYFWIGPPQENIPHGSSISAAAAMHMKTAFKKKITGLDAKSAQRLLLPASPAPVKKGVAVKGALVTPTTPPPPPVSTPPGGTVGAAKPALARNVTAIAPRAVVKLETVAFKPAPLLAGTPVDAMLTFKNAGTAPSDPGLTYTLACTVKSGGHACPVAGTTRLVSATALDPGQGLTVTLAGASPAEPGSYELSIAIGQAKAKVYPFVVNAPKLKIQPQKTLKKNLTPGQ
jgi:hypothetical protein